MSDIITSGGVLLILIAFFANVTGQLSKNQTYFWLNAVGSMLTGIGAFMVGLIPIVVLESIWAAVSLYEISLIYKSKKLNK